MLRKVFEISLALLVLFSGCSDKKQKVSISIVRSEKILFIFDSTDPYAQSCVGNARQAFRYAKLNYDEFDLANYPMNSFPDLRNYYAVVLATELIKKLTPSDCQKIKNYISAGGGLAVIYRGYNENFSDVFGAKLKDKVNLFRKEGRSGLRFVDNFVPGIKNTFVPDSIFKDLSMFAFVHSPEIEVIAQSSAGVPVAWFKRYGMGKVIFWNTSILSEKLFRGLITQSVASVSGRFIQPIPNFAVIFIDDFPTSVYNIKKRIVWQDLNMTMAEFHLFAFYPDMMKLANEFDLKYTAGLVFNYGAGTEKPFHLTDWRAGKVFVGGKEIEVPKFIAKHFSKKHELAFHGYNHFSLLIDDWGSVDKMVDALRFAMQKWEEEGLGKLPTTYIPPTNWIDSFGVRAIEKGLPSVKIIAGLYFGNFEVGQNREFGPEPWNPKLYHIPRISAGFLIDDYTKLIILSGVAMLGVWTHFIHPDDIIYTLDEVEDPELVRNWFDLPWRGKDSSGLYFKFREWISKFKKNYPFVRFLTCSQAYEEMRKFDALRIDYQFSNEKVLIKANQKNFYIIVQSDPAQKVESALNAEIVDIIRTQTTNYHVIRALDENIILEFTPSP